MQTPIDLQNRIVKRYAGNGISITDDRVVSVLLRADNNLAKFTANGELFVDLQLPDGIQPSYNFPVGVNVGHVLQTDGRPATGVLVVHKTTSGQVVKLIFSNDGYVYKDVGNGFEQWANVKTVNNIGPDANGNITLDGGHIPFSDTDLVSISTKLTEEVSRATTNEQELENDIEANTNAINTINSNNTTPGSIAHAVQQEADARHEEDEDIWDELGNKQDKLSPEQVETVNGDKFNSGNYSTTQEMNAAIQQAISSSEGGLFKFIGYVSTTTPAGTIKIDDLWINSATMPTTFPVSGVKRWNGASWEDTTDYTPSLWDLRANISDNHGYYFFNQSWNMIDASVDLSNYYTISQIDTALGLKQNVLTEEQLEVVNENPFTDDYKNKLDGVAANANATVITDNLTTETTGNALDAHQGYVLKNLIDEKSPSNITLADNAGSSTLPSTASQPVKTKIQALRDNVKELQGRATPGTLDTTQTTAQSTSSNEALSGNVKLHKVSKTGNYQDLLNQPTAEDIEYSQLIMPDGIHYVGNDIIVSYGGEQVIIADRNVGATQAGTEEAAYGDYFQRGNNYGFANSGSIATSTSLVPNASSYGPSPLSYYSGSNFIITPGVSSSSKYDYWIGAQNDNLRGGSASDGPTTIPNLQDALDRQGPCPDGYHVPSAGEWNKLLIIRAGIRGVDLYDDDGYKSFGDSMEATRFRNDLLLPLAGYRNYNSSASVNSKGSNGSYWSSSPDSTNARNLRMDSSSANASYYNNRAYGFSLRPFKNQSSVVSVADALDGIDNELVNINQTIANNTEDMTFYDYTGTITNFNHKITPTDNVTISLGGGTVREGACYILDINTGATAYTVYLGTGVSNPFDEDLSLTVDKKTRVIMLATSSTTLEVQQVMTAV